MGDDPTLFHDLDRLGSRNDILADLVRDHRRGGDAAVIIGAPGLGKTTALRATVQRSIAAGYRVFSLVERRVGAAVDALAALTREADDRPETPLAHLIGRAAQRRPCLIAVDDLQALPEHDRSALVALVEELSDRPVLFAFASDRLTADALPGAVIRRELQPLGPASAAALLRGQPAPVEGFTRYEALRRAAGNPRALVELARAAAASRRSGAVQAPAPDTTRIQRMYAGQLAALPERTREAMVYLAARVGDEPPSALRAAGIDELDESLWRPAVQARLLTVNRDIAFVDPLTAVALYDDAPAERRRRVHQDFAASPHTPAFERAYHDAMSVVGIDPARAAALERASADARSEGRLAESVWAAQLSAQLSATPAQAGRRYVEALLGCAAIGDGGWCRELVAAAEASVADPDLRLLAAMAMSLTLSREGVQRQAMDRLLRAVDSVPSARPPIAVPLALTAAVIANRSGLPEHMATVRAMRADIAAHQPESGVIAEVQDPRLAFIDATIDPHAAARFRVSREILEREPYPLGNLDKHFAAELVDAVADTETAVRLWHEALRTPGVAGGVPAWPEMWPSLIESLIELGRWGEADEALDAAAELDDEHGLPQLRVQITALRASLAALRGDGRTARALADSVWTLLTLDCNRAARLVLIRALALSAIANGDYQTAYRHFRSLNEEETERPYIRHAAHPMLGMATAGRRVGRVDEAAALLTDVQSALRGKLDNRMRITLEHAWAILDTDDRTEARFLSAINDEHAPIWPFSHALARYHFGTWLRRARRPAEARGHLRAAYTTFSGMGANAMAEAARVELRASGGAPADTMPSRLARTDSAWALLSPQQREVARLAAAGLRNREIAEQLGLSPRTVSTHLSNTYLRLGITARHQLRDIES